MRIERGSFSKHLQSKIIEHLKLFLNQKLWLDHHSNRPVETIPMNGQFKEFD